MIKTFVWKKTKFLDPGLWTQDLGSWTQSPVSWIQDQRPGFWMQDRDSDPGSRTGFKILRPGPGSWIFTLRWRHSHGKDNVFRLIRGSKLPYRFTGIVLCCFFAVVAHGTLENSLAKWIPNHSNTNNMKFEIRVATPIKQTNILYCFVGAPINVLPPNRYWRTFNTSPQSNNQLC